MGECLLNPLRLGRLGLFASFGDKEAKCVDDGTCPIPWRPNRLFAVPEAFETTPGGLDVGGGILRLPGGNTFLTFFPMKRPPGLISLVLNEKLRSFI